MFFACLSVCPIVSNKLFLFLFNNVYKKKMFKIELEDGREVPQKPNF